MNSAKRNANSLGFRLRSKELGNSLVIRATVKRQDAGYLFGIVSENEMQLSDLFLREYVACPLFPCLGNFSPQIRLQIRSRGIGTAMLKTAIKRARFLGVSRVVGFVTENDLHTSPFLLSWYRRLGFRINDPSHDSFPKLSREISLSGQDLFEGRWRTA